MYGEVRFRDLSEILRIRNGKDYKKVNAGKIPVYGSGGIMTHIAESLYDKPSVLIPRKGSIGNLFYVDNPFWTVDTLFYTEINTSIVIPKYVYYCLQKANLEKLNTAGGVPSLTQAVLNHVSIPVPPLPIQEEIVRILDTFTELIAKLTAELTAELTARKSQYEYYRNSLLQQKDTPRIPVGELCLSTSTGVTPKADKSEYYEGGTIPWLRTQEVKFVDIWDTEMRITEKALKETSLKIIPANCVIVAISGATAGRVGINKIPMTTNQHCCCLEIDERKALYRYVYHCLSNANRDLLQLKQGARGDLNAGLIKRFTIPVPALKEQARIVEILDKFDELTTDISNGLPAEIEARKKQYEYYRDKLLTFKELKQ
jgi:type I restriction enzyme S subunit